MGAVKSRRKTAGAGRTTTLHPAGVSGAGLTAAGIPQDRFLSRPIVTAVRLMFTIIAVFIMLFMQHDMNYILSP